MAKEIVGLGRDESARCLLSVAGQAFFLSKLKRWPTICQCDWIPSPKSTISLPSTDLLYPSHRSNTGTGLGEAVKAPFRKLRRKKHWLPELPVWLNPEFAERVKLKDRWLTIWQLWGELTDTYGQLQRPWFDSIFGSYESLKIPWVVRHPYSDVRLVEFMLRTPNYMNYNKRLLREAMQTRLPAELVTRLKAGLPGDIFKLKMATGQYAAPADLTSTDPYVDRISYEKACRKFLRADTSSSTWTTWLMNNPIALAYWINNNKHVAEDQ
mgnify:CR=1 FL=1